MRAIIILSGLALAALTACKSSVEVGTTSGTGAAGGAGGAGAGGAGGGSNATDCPETAPFPAESCDGQDGAHCTYNQGDQCYSTLVEAVCTSGAWQITTKDHDDCCPDEMPGLGDACTPSPLAGGLDHPCSYFSSGCGGQVVFHCVDGVWVSPIPPCPPK
ncbi:MAG: hypothetical protein QM820_30600 [Minicystis sp.]